MADIELDSATALAALKVHLASLSGGNTFVGNQQMGDLTVTDNGPVSRITDANGDVDRKSVYFFKDSEKTYWRSETDAGGKIRDWIEVNDDDGNFDISEAVSFTPPDTITPRASATPIHVDGMMTIGRRSINAQSGTTYTLDLTDAGKIVTLSNSSPVTVTVPPDTDADFPIGASIDIIGIGVGLVTIVEGTDVQVNTPRTLSLRAQHSAATLVKTTAADGGRWQLMGDLAP